MRWTFSTHSIRKLTASFYDFKFLYVQVTQNRIQVRVFFLCATLVVAGH